ncbi:MAG: alpha/beta fold hydrolase [Verrucomicrobiales bacterium]|nr:alpha/beta fold hydrolase [Verrucomicrobiales bacterium]
MADIVFIHGMWSHGNVAAPLKEFFEKAGHRFHAPDLPGHDRESGLSRMTQSPLSIKRYVSSIEAFILNERFETPPVIIGHSMGGLVAQLVSARIETGPLILLNSAASSGINHLFPSTALTTLSVLLKPFFWRRNHRLNARLGKYGIFNCVRPEKAGEIINTLKPESGRCFFEVVFSMLDRSKTTQVDPESIKTPILVVSSMEDKIIPPRVARAIYDHYPQAEYHGFAGHGHWIFHESGSERVYQALSDWLEALDISFVTNEEENGSIEEPLQTHHNRPQLYPTTKKVPTPKRSRLIPFPVSAGRFRRGTLTETSTDGGAVLPR